MFIVKYLSFKQSCENSKWLGENFDVISGKLIRLVHNESREVAASYLENFKNCNCFWDSIKKRVDLYLEKVNNKLGLPILEMVSNYMASGIFHFVLFSLLTIALERMKFKTSKFSVNTKLYFHRIIIFIPW